MHINKFKPYHSKGQFQTVKGYFPEQTFQFQKQGGDVNPENNFDGAIKENYPNWNNNQIINYWWSGGYKRGTR